MVIITHYYYYSKKEFFGQKWRLWVNESMETDEFKRQNMKWSQDHYINVNIKTILDININIRNKNFLPLPVHCTMLSALYIFFIQYFLLSHQQGIITPLFYRLSSKVGSELESAWHQNPCVFFFNPPRPLLWLFLFDLLCCQLTPFESNVAILTTLSWTIFVINSILSCSNSPLWCQLPSRCGWCWNLSFSTQSEKWLEFS